MLRKLSGVFSSRKNIFRNFGSGIIEQLKVSRTQRNILSEYSYLLILDFEATCNNEKIVQEIIEFPCLKVNAKSLKEESRFHYYVKPILNPNLSNFCIKLTGILQEMVDDAHRFPEVLRLFEKWRESENLSEENSIYVTSGDWDLGHMIPTQCKLDNLEVPQHMMQWIDIKKMYANNFNQYYNSFIEIMKSFDLNFIGRPHSGIDDCHNMLRVVEKFGKLGLKFDPTSQLINVNSNWKVHIIGSRKFTPPKMWNKGSLGNCE